jgi:hypothetical protein
MKIGRNTSLAASLPLLSARQNATLHASEGWSCVGVQKIDI